MEAFTSIVGGRLQAFWRNWDRLFDDPWLVRTLREGYELDLASPPPLTMAPYDQVYLDIHHLALSEAVGKLVMKGAVRELALLEITPGFYSEVFLVPKKDSPEFRMIHSLKTHSRLYLVRLPKFRMPLLASLIHTIRRGDYLASIDLRGAYLHVKIVTCQNE